MMVVDVSKSRVEGEKITHTYIYSIEWMMGHSEDLSRK
jgi:hypothetical protein